MGRTIWINDTIDQLIEQEKQHENEQDSKALERLVKQQSTAYTAKLEDLRNVLGEKFIKKVVKQALKEHKQEQETTNKQPEDTETGTWNKNKL